jgi:hypothetical protein
VAVIWQVLVLKRLPYHCLEFLVHAVRMRLHAKQLVGEQYLLRHDAKPALFVSHNYNNDEALINYQSVLR